MIIKSDNCNKKYSIDVEIIDNKSNLKRYLNYLNKNRYSLCHLYLDGYNDKRDTLYILFLFNVYNDFYIKFDQDYLSSHYRYKLTCYLWTDPIFYSRYCINYNKKYLIKLDK